MRKYNNIYAINPSLSFVDELARGVLLKHGDNPLKLSSVVIFLPNKRSCLSLREAFLRQSEGRPLLLPAIRALGDIDDDDSLFISDILGDTEDAISPLKRRLILTEIVKNWHDSSSHEEKINIEQASYLAYELAVFLDEVQSANLSFDKLKDIVKEEELASHWQLTLDFFDILTKEYPHKLQKLGLIDPIIHRNKIIAAQTENWRQNPPNFPVIIAGSTASLPITQEFANVIAGLEEGYIILPSLDQALDDDSYSLLLKDNDESHFQFGLAALLQKLAVSRHDVRDWSSGDIFDKFSARQKLLSEALRPIESVDKWRDLSLSKDCTEGLSLIELESTRHESDVISMILRQAIEQKHKTAALITNDRNLARSVTSKMKQWGINIDNFAGQPLANTPVMVFLSLMIEAINSRYSPNSLLALFKHPLCSCGYRTSKFNKIISFLEKNILRGVRNTNGISGLIQELNNLDEHTDNKDKNTIEMLERFDKIIKNLEYILSQNAPNLAEILNTHIKAAEMLCENDEKSGEQRLWLREEGEKTSQFIAELLDSSQDFVIPDPMKSYLGIFKSLLMGLSCTSLYEKTHSRLKILTPMEARLQSFDLVVLGAMNDGIWPQEPFSMWMNRSMRVEFGLPSTRRRVGQSAHDFYSLACANEVIITRSQKLGTSPSSPSAWILRLKTVLESLDMLSGLSADLPWQSWAQEYSNPQEFISITPPNPKPPLSARPDSLYVTQIEKLMRDPYSVYASHILRLLPLDEIDKEPSAAEFGNIIHRALEDFASQYEEIGFEPNYERLCEYGRKSFAELGNRPSIIAVWWPRFENIAKWFVEKEISRRKNISTIKLESSGKLLIELDNNNFYIKAKADRIELSNEGEITIIDYKTGAISALSDIASGLSPQLTLEAMIAHAGGFQGIAKGAPIGELFYWKLSGRNDANREVCALGSGSNKIASEALYELTYSGITSLLEEFSSQNCGYQVCPDPDIAPKYNNYEHLSRIKEWRN